ncbi:MAG: hypothetical protein JWN70_6984 [Planctomycetaceae bacterium]|nr:hypothetical protein [Planctomycetaceae bacterium]
MRVFACHGMVPHGLIAPTVPDREAAEGKLVAYEELAKKQIADFLESIKDDAGWMASTLPTVCTA